MKELKDGIVLLGDMEKLKIEAGDKFVLTADRPLTQQAVERLRAAWDDFSGGARSVLILDAGMKLGVIGDGWREIDSVPRDRPVIIWEIDTIGPGQPSVARFELEYDLPADDATERLRFRNSAGFYNIRASHWMEQPNPPRAAAPRKTEEEENGVQRKN